MKTTALITAFILAGFFAPAQSVTSSPEYIKALTPEWTGERSADGRPKVSDGLLERLKSCTMEDVWEQLRPKGYVNQFENYAGKFENDWIILHPDQPMTGRVVTAQYMPQNPSLQNYVQAQGVREKNPLRITNSSPINILTDGDVYVADGYGKMAEGTLIGSNLANAIWSGSHRGFIFDGSIRDLEEVLQVKGMNGWIRGSDPSAIGQMMLTTINAPIRIGRATVLPGDVVLAKRTGIIFIPAFLLADVVIAAEMTALKDAFTFLRINEKKYEYKNEGFVGGWSEIIDKDYVNWLNNEAKLPMSKQEMNDYLTAHPRIRPAGAPAPRAPGGAGGAGRPAGGGAGGGAAGGGR